MNAPFNITSPSCKLWLAPGAGYAFQGYSVPDGWLGASGAGIPDNGQVQYCGDASGNANTVTQSTVSSAPLLSQFGGIAESQEPALRFRSGASQFLPIPSGVKMGDGSPASEGTIIICLRLIPGAAGCLWTTSGPALQVGYPSAQQTTIRFNNNFFTFPNPFAINTFGPQVIAIRFNSAGVKLYGDTNYTDTLSNVLLSGTVSGGFIGSYNASLLFTDFDLFDFAQFDQALSDADVLTVMQGMKDRVAPTEGQSAQVLAFGDSRTAGYNSNEGALPICRSWPGRVKRALGGAGQFYSSAHIGDTIANQATALASWLPLLKPAIYSKRIVMGEVGVNDVNAGTSAATIQASLASLATQIIAGGATQTIFLTIAPGASITGSKETVRQTVNTWLKAGSISGITVIDNAADTRLPVPGYADNDGLHFYDPGYGVYAENMTAALQPLFFANSASAVNLNYGTFRAA